MHSASFLKTTTLGVAALAGLCACRAQGFMHHHTVVPPVSADFLTGKMGWSIAEAGGTIIAGAPLALPGGGAVAWPTAEFVSGTAPASTTLMQGDSNGGASIAANDGVLAMSTCSALDAGYCATDANSVFLFQDDGTWSALTTIQRPPWTQGVFGHAIAINGDHLAIGAERTDEPGAEMPVVYLYHRTNGSWPALPTDSLVGDAGPNDKFGSALAMDAEHLLVGAYRDNELGQGAGAAYVFRYEADGSEQWILLRKLLASNGVAGDGFGRAVALDGDRCAVGATGHASDTVRCGAVYVFNEDQGLPGNWGEEAALSPIQPRDHMGYGMSVALGGDKLVTGAPLDPITFPGSSGSLDVHARTGDQWQPVQYISPTDLGLVSVGSRCAQSLALVGDALLVGAPWSIVPGQTTTTAGSILVFHAEPVGLEEQSVARLHAWPVPADERLFISLDHGRSTAFQVTLLDALGVHHPCPWSLVQGSCAIPLGDLPAGVYSVVLTERMTDSILAIGSIVHGPAH